MAVDEGARLTALSRYKILDTDPERAFDDLTLLASQICGTPIALITIVDADRQWFKSRVGITTTETARSISFCSHAIKQPGLFVVPDAQSDRQFSSNPLVVDDPHIRFYAGAPLVTHDGHALGTLCVLDRVPRTLTRDQVEALHALKRQVEAQLELRANLMQLRSALTSVNRLSALVPYCSKCVFDMAIPADPAAIQTVSDGVTQMLEGKGWEEHDVMRVELALQEALANAIRHGCKGDPSKQLQCCVTIDESGDVLIVVRDPGAGFDHAAVPDPREPENLLKSSGRGIFLINELMDEVAFADGGRELQMRRRKEPHDHARSPGSVSSASPPE